MNILLGKSKDTLYLQKGFRIYGFPHVICYLGINYEQSSGINRVTDQEIEDSDSSKLMNEYKERM